MWLKAVWVLTWHFQGISEGSITKVKKTITSSLLWCMVQVFCPWLHCRSSGTFMVYILILRRSRTSHFGGYCQTATEDILILLSSLYLQKNAKAFAGLKQALFGLREQKKKEQGWPVPMPQVFFFMSRVWAKLDITPGLPVVLYRVCYSLESCQFFSRWQW